MELRSYVMAGRPKPGDQARDLLGDILTNDGARYSEVRQILTHAHPAPGRPPGYVFLDAYEMHQAGRSYPEIVDLLCDPLEALPSTTRTHQNLLRTVP